VDRPCKDQLIDDSAEQSDVFLSILPLNSSHALLVTATNNPV